jgi:hypothetical protein
MYGIVNQSFYGLITDHYGVEKWEAIKKSSGVDQDYFVSNQPYEDNITFELLAAASEELEISSDEILQAFGEYWILKTGAEKYGDLMKSGGNSFTEFLINLPNFHSRIMLIYPNLNPPEFAVERMNENIMRLHYYSERKGLTHFVIGLIYGISKMYDEAIEIQHIENRQEQVWHDTFDIRLI